MANNELRRQPRVRDDIPVSWSIQKKGEQGKGILRNLSVSGAMLETRLSLSVANVVIDLQAQEPLEQDLVPSSARVLWGKQAKEGRGYSFYGIEFNSLTDSNRAALAAHVEVKMRSVSFGLGTGISDNNFFR